MSKKLEPIDFDNDNDLARWNEHPPVVEHEEYADASQLETFLKTGNNPPLSYQQNPVFMYGQNTCGWILKDNLFFYFETGCGSLGDISETFDFKDALDQDPVGVLLYQKTKSTKYVVLANGDMDIDDSLVITIEPLKMPVVSFNCLTQFYGDPLYSDSVLNVLKKIANGTIQLLDHTCDERVELTRKEKTVLRRKNGAALLKPKLGFSLVNKKWHRSGTCLFRDESTGQCFLLGQDEGTYFGVELSSKASTVKEAFELLTPKEARGVGVKRQGEWFMVPVKEKDVPDTKDTLLQFETDYHGHAFLPLETRNSNRHDITTTDGRVGKDGKVYAKNPNISHDQHVNISGSGWFTFYKNTAVRSVSQEGVD